MDAENEIEPTAQDSSTEADPQVEAQEPVVEGGKEKRGAEARIDELTAKFRSLEGVLSAKDKQIGDLTAALMATSQSRVQQQPDPNRISPEELEDVDPKTMNIINRIVGQIDQKYAQQFQRLEGTLAVSAVAREAARQGEESREVVARAEELMDQWRRKGLPLAPLDALTFARGEALEQSRQSGQRHQPRNGQVTLTQQARQNTYAPPQQQEAALPSNFDDWSPDKQIAYLDKRGVSGRKI